jgi:TonB-linked SusC/RagA family outer membrane protein
MIAGFMLTGGYNGFAQQGGETVSGSVFDSELTPQPIPGATVVIKGTTLGTTTDPDGRFTIRGNVGDTVQVSFIGYQVYNHIIVRSVGNLFVQLREKTAEVGEVVVVALGTQKKEASIGSITTVNPASLRVPSSNLTTAFAGRLAGVISYQRSGEPGADNADFFIRGVTTFGYKKDPLILIDGIESSTTDLSRLSIDDIENFSIMKDATATALYGSRAANGVILIQTKEGREGPANIQVRIENSISMPTRNVDLADPITYMRMHNEAVLTRDPLGKLPYQEQKIDNTIAGINPVVFPVTDWRKELLKDYTSNQRVNLNISGGGKVARYYVAGSFVQNNGLLKVDKRNNFNSNIDLKTYQLRTNVNINITKSTKMDFKISGTFDEYTGPIGSGTQVYRNVMRTNPVMFPAYYPIDEEHLYVKHIMFGNYQDDDHYPYLNPYADMVKGYMDYSRSNMSAQFEVRQDLSALIKGLDFRILASTTRNAYFDVTRQYTPFWYQATSYDQRANTYKLIILNEDSGTEWLNYVPGSRTISTNFYSESALNFSQTYKDTHAVSGLLVFMVQNQLTGEVSSLQSSLPYRNVGFAGRATYAYDNRYFTEFNFGYNASERFHESHRWGFFPSVGVGWLVSNEEFWTPLKETVSNLKIKFTEGLTGNDAIGSSSDRFMYLSEVNMNNSSYGASFGRDQNNYQRNGMSISRYSDPAITWEKALKTNLGLELGLFKTIEVQLDLYKEHRTNILQTRAATPAEMGLSAQPRTNIGEARAKGIDLSVDYNKSFNKDLWLQARANFTYAASQFEVYEEYDYTNMPWLSHVGYSINQTWGLLAERLFIDDAEAAKSPVQNYGKYQGGDIKFRDVNNDGQITDLDRAPIGYPTSPEIVYGFGFSAGYKGFDFSVFFQGLARESFWINAQATAPFMEFRYSGESLSGWPQNQLLAAYAADHWSEDNQNIYALWPRFSTTGDGNTNNYQTSTWFMRDGSFLRLKQVEIGYSLSQRTLDKLLMKKCRLYLQTTNPLVWSNFKLWDVEMGGNGLGYPIQKVFNIGLQVSF